MKTIKNLQLERLARKKSKEIFISEHGEKKVNIWVCGDIILPSSKKVNCYECGKICYYDSKTPIKISKNVRKICLVCAYKNHFNDMTALEQDIIKNCVEIKRI